MKTMVVLLLYVSVMTAQFSKSQIDSLQAVISGKAHDTSKVKAWLKLEYAHRFTDYKKGLTYAETGLNLAKKVKWDKGIATAYNNIGGNYLDRGEHAAALENYKKSLEYSSKEPKKRLTALANISNVYLREENFALADKYNDDAYKIAIEIKDTLKMAYAYYQFGLIRRNQEKFDEATGFFKKGLILFRKYDQPFEIAELTTFIGEVTKDYQLKIRYILESKAIWDKLMPDYISAINNSILLAKTYIEIVKDDKLKQESKVTKSNAQLLAEAEQLLLTTIKQSKAADIKQYLMDSYGALATLKAMKQDYAAAYQFGSLHETLKDSIFSQESKNKIAALESAKEIARRDNEIKINKLTLKTKETEKWFLVSALGLLAIIGGLVYKQSRNRKKNNQKLQLLNTDLAESNKVKLRFLSILNHDLRSPVSSFIHYIQLKEEDPKVMDDETKKRIEQKMETSARHLLATMEDILVWAKDQMDNFKLHWKNVSADAVFTATKMHFANEKKVQIYFENPESIELLADENYLKTIIRNLTGNAIKATDKTENPTVIVKAWTESGKKWLSVSDNGKGVGADQIKALFDENKAVEMQSGLGLHLIRDLAKSIHCKISVHSEPGNTVFLLEFEK